MTLLGYVLALVAINDFDNDPYAAGACLGCGLIFFGAAYIGLGFVLPAIWLGLSSAYWHRQANRLLKQH